MIRNKKNDNPSKEEIFSSILTCFAIDKSLKSKKWEKIKETWINSYRNREEIIGLSVCKEVNCIDDWCAEAHLPTDIKKLTNKDFTQKVRNYLSFLVKENHFELFDEFVGKTLNDDIQISEIN